MENLVKISDIFQVEYGVNLELVNLDQCDASDPNAIFFVSRTENNNGVSAIVRKVAGIEPNPGHTLSVAGGGSVLSTFYQPKPYYSGRDLYVLIPKREMSVVEMLFYAYCIQLNKYKYNYGRQANRTLKDILIPEIMPDGFEGIEQTVVKSIQDISLNALSGVPITDKKQPKSTPLSDAELVEKYESDAIPIKKVMRAMLKTKPPEKAEKK